MELMKTEYSESRGKGKLDKILLKSNESNYSKLSEFLYTSQNEHGLIFKALYECDTNIVLKFGIFENIEKECKIIDELNELPNFIRYFCMLICNEDIKNIINDKRTLPDYKMVDIDRGILVMEEYKLGCVENYNWCEKNFDTLKNIIKQVIFVMLYAYETKGFIHGNLHSGNVLLKPKINNEIIYGKKKLKINELEVVIIDFEKSKVGLKNKMRFVIANINRFITSLEYGNNINLNFDYDRNKLNFSGCQLDDNTNYYEELENIIDNMVISK